MDINVHKFQISILRELLFHPEARFRDLKKVDISNDHFSFHLNQLIKEGLVIKNNGKYSLTPVGKEFANRMDTDTLTFVRQAKIAIAIHATRTVGGKIQYLVHKRLKEPFFGWYGSISGKVNWGEVPLDAARREMQEETGLTGDFELKGIVHYHHIHSDGTFLEDKYFWVYHVTNVQGEFKAKVHEGENIWMNADEYSALKNVFGSFKGVKEMLEGKSLVYKDKIQVVDSY